MAFTGKATYAAGADLPEIMEDVSDIISIVSPHETPLLDRLGDAKSSAQSTVHEWLEDTLLPNTDAVNQSSFVPNAQDATSITVYNGARFQVGDQVRPGTAQEIMLVTAVSTNVLTVVRRYGNTPASSLALNIKLTIVGNGALEGADAPAARFTNRVRRQNYTQIFSAGVEVSGSMQAVRIHGVDDKIDYQKQERARELLRDLENCVINGTAPAASQQGSSTTRRTMNGILKLVTTNLFVPGQNGFPAGGGGGQDLNETLINTALRLTWEQSAGTIDTMVVGGTQKRRINQFVTGSRHYTANDTNIRDLVSIYESDFGVCRVLLSRWVPADTIIFLDSARVQVVPLKGRSFGYQAMGASGDRTTGQVLGEYTLEFRNENAHAVLRGLNAA